MLPLLESQRKIKKINIIVALFNNFICTCFISSLSWISCLFMVMLASVILYHTGIEAEMGMETIKVARKIELMTIH